MSKLTRKIYVMGLLAQEKVSKLLKDEKGDTNIVAIILILAIVIALAIVFRGAIMGLFNRIWGSLNTEVDKVL